MINPTYPVPVAMSAMLNKRSLGIEGWMTFPPNKSTRYLCWSSSLQKVLSLVPFPQVKGFL